MYMIVCVCVYASGWTTSFSCLVPLEQVWKLDQVSLSIYTLYWSQRRKHLCTHFESSQFTHILYTYNIAYTLVYQTWIDAVSNLSTIVLPRWDGRAAVVPAWKYMWDCMNKVTICHNQHSMLMRFDRSARVDHFISINNSKRNALQRKHVFDKGCIR